MAETAGNGLLDLEKELTCSICTEILYQPLTLLDCLHTFCGSCLKEWFGWQATQSKSRRTNPYTCPSCRASVRGTRPDAKITTLLDMYLKANPDKGKTAEERAELTGKYKPGDNVIPRVVVREDDGDAVDRRMVEEIREMSLRDAGRHGSREHERGTRHRSRDSRTRQAVANSEHGTGSTGAGSAAAGSSHHQNVEHQPSLRSLISSSDSAEMEEEILRQILEEGLLDGIDLHNLDVTQEDELSERIADAYRQRHMRSLDTQRTEEHRRRADSTQPRSTVGRHSRSASNTDPPASSSRPPVSRPHLFESYPASQGSRRRTSSETRGDRRRQTAPGSSSVSVAQQATRSATDLSNRPRSSGHRERRPSDASGQGRRSTDTRPHLLTEGNRRVSSEQDTRSRASPSRVSPRRISPVPGPVTSPTATQTLSPMLLELPGISSPRGRITTSNGRSSTMSTQQPVSERPRVTSAPQSTAATAATTAAAAAARPRPTLYPEPSVCCDKCGKLDIQYDLHYNCSACQSGNYNICYRCYRSGTTLCPHWYGFGYNAWIRFQQRAAPDQELPHTLIGRVYLKPRQGTIQPSAGNERRAMTTEDPATRLRSGAFCANCKAYAEDWFWRCDTCNDGEWGFCNQCVDQGKCCTHPLLPIAHVSSSARTKAALHVNDNGTSGGGGGGAHSEASFAPITSPNMIQAYPPSNLSPSGQYRPLSISVGCSICHYPIQPSQSRYHCYECNEGKHNICTPCYSKLVESGRIGRENGERGWRRCLRGHRTVVLGFQDTPLGQQRVVVRDLVGGHFLKDDDDNQQGGAGAEVELDGQWRWHDGESSKTRTISRKNIIVPSPSSSNPHLPAPPLLESKLPPDGGVGLVLVATYTWLPAEGVTDELSFPRGAEIREAEEISEEWYLGYYAGCKGIFPANYARVLGVVTM